MKTKRVASISQASRIIRGAYQWHGEAGEWYSAEGVAEGLAVLEAAAIQITAWGDEVLRELARDEGYAEWVDAKRAELARLLGGAEGGAP